MINTYEHIHWKYAGINESQIAAYKKYYRKVFSDLPINSIHDCSCGSGALTFPIIYLGYDVSGSDISNYMIKLINERVEKESLKNNFFEADFTILDKYFDTEIDCLISTGNSLAHVDSNGISQFIACASRIVKDKGYFYFDSRNWDKILSEKQRFFPHKLIIGKDYYQHFLQVWDYNPDGTITFNLLPHDFDKDGNIIGKDYQYAPPYYPILYNQLVNELNKNGFRVMQRYNFDILGLWGTQKNKNIDLIQSEEDFKLIDWYSLLAIKDI